MVEHALVNPFVRIEGTIESVMGLSPGLLDKLWDQISVTTERPGKRKLESNEEAEPKSKSKPAVAAVGAAGATANDVSGNGGGDGSS